MRPPAPRSRARAWPGPRRGARCAPRRPRPPRPRVGEAERVAGEGAPASKSSTVRTSRSSIPSHPARRGSLSAPPGSRPPGRPPRRTAPPAQREHRARPLLGVAAIRGRARRRRLEPREPERHGVDAREAELEHAGGWLPRSSRMRGVARAATAAEASRRPQGRERPESEQGAPAVKRSVTMKGPPREAAADQRPTSPSR